MTDSLERRVTDELHGRATALDVPPPPVDALVQGGLALRAQRRRRIRVLTAAAAVIAVGLAIGIPQVVDRGASHQPAPAHRPSQGPTEAPKSVDDLPAGHPPAVPYLHAGALHFGQLVVPTTADELISVGASVLVGRSGQAGSRWWLLDGVRLRAIPELDGQSAPLLDPSGTVAVWTSYPDAATTRVNVWNLDRRREVDHVDLPAPHADCCGGGQPIELWGIDAEHAVYWHDADWGNGSSRDVVWMPGHSPRPLVGAGHLTGTAPITPLGPINSSGTYGNVAPDGRFEQLGRLTGQGTVWSADGSTVALVGPDGASGVVVRRLDDNNEVRGPGVSLGLPAGAEVAAMEFESSDQLLVRVWLSAKRHVLVRCPTDGGPCERALDMPAPSGWVLPEQLS